MKTKSLYLCCFLLVTLAGVQRLFAQQPTTGKSLPPIVISSSTIIEPVVTDIANEIFQEHNDPVWYLLDRDYLFKLMTKDLITPALFDKDGSITYTISWGPATILPLNLRDLINSIYPKYNITLAIYVSRSKKVIWIANLEQGDNLYLIHLEEDQMNASIQLLKTVSRINE